MQNSYSETKSEHSDTTTCTLKSEEKESLSQMVDRALENQALLNKMLRCLNKVLPSKNPSRNKDLS